jgi:hypothetical protein
MVVIPKGTNPWFIMISNPQSKTDKDIGLET